MEQTGKLVILLGVVLLVVVCNTAWAMPAELEGDSDESGSQFSLRELFDVSAEKRLIRPFFMIADRSIDSKSSERQ